METNDIMIEYEYIIDTQIAHIAKLHNAITEQDEYLEELYESIDLMRVKLGELEADNAQLRLTNAKKGKCIKLLLNEGRDEIKTVCNIKYNIDDVWDEADAYITIEASQDEKGL